MLNRILEESHIKTIPLRVLSLFMIESYVKTKFSCVGKLGLLLRIMGTFWVKGNIKAIPSKFGCN